MLILLQENPGIDRHLIFWELSFANSSEFLQDFSLNIIY